MEKMIKGLREEREEYNKVEWISSRGARTKIINMSNEYLLNVLKTTCNKSIIAEQLQYVEEFQSYEGYTYCTWVRYFYNEYLYRKQEGIVLEDSMETESVNIEEGHNPFKTSSNIYHIS